MYGNNSLEVKNEILFVFLTQMKTTDSIHIPDLIRVHQAELTRLCQLHKVKTLFLFGSALTDRFRHESDIDLLITFHPMEVLNYSSNYFGLQRETRAGIGTFG